jgi:hypothetical protein
VAQNACGAGKARPSLRDSYILASLPRTPRVRKPRPLGVLGYFRASLREDGFERPRCVLPLPRVPNAETQGDVTCCSSAPCRRETNHLLLNYHATSHGAGTEPVGVPQNSSDPGPQPFNGMRRVLRRACRANIQSAPAADDSYLFRSIRAAINQPPSPGAYRTTLRCSPRPAAARPPATSLPGPSAGRRSLLPSYVAQPCLRGSASGSMRWFPHEF